MTSAIHKLVICRLAVPTSDDLPSCHCSLVSLKAIGESFNGSFPRGRPTPFFCLHLPRFRSLSQVDGVSLISRVVLNGTQVGGCYNNTMFSINDNLAYFSSDVGDEWGVGDRAILVMPPNVSRARP